MTVHRIIWFGHGQNRKGLGDLFLTSQSDWRTGVPGAPNITPLVSSAQKNNPTHTMDNVFSSELADSLSSSEIDAVRDLDSPSNDPRLLSSINSGDEILIVHDRRGTLSSTLPDPLNDKSIHRFW